MKGIIKLLVCIIIIVILWHNFDQIIMVGDTLIHVILNKLMSLK